ncbi:MAG: trypsin-like peptidase domain-containing protein [Hyphomicrobiales bacterium]|nr:trypsin-like peptidase domain-containing protein [Hyphomicrobiales bacterium]
MKYIPIIILMLASNSVEAAIPARELLASLYSKSNPATQPEDFNRELGTVTVESLSVVEAEPYPAPPTLTYADVLEAPLRAVVRVESWVGPVSEAGSPKSTGSGVIINAHGGYIVTNSHVVAPGDHFRVQLADGRWREATLSGTDAVTDLAVLKIGPADLEEIEPADTTALRVGDIVFAVGYPLGLDQTASIGIVSGLGRSGSDTQLTDYIQTDAAINSGNSGGALLDAKGQLVGINTAILSSSGGNIGIGFAIPAHVALAVADQLIDSGEVKHGHIGVVLGAVDEMDSAKAGTLDWDGARIVAVEPGSPAEAAGLKADDIIVKFNGHRIKSPESLRTWIGVTRIGGNIDLEVWRGGAHLSFTLKPVSINRPGAASIAELGAVVKPLSQADAAPSGLEGVRIESIRKNSPAEHAGLLPGDIILSINNELVTNPQVCDRLVHEASGRVGVVVYRSGMVRRLIIGGSVP